MTGLASGVSAIGSRRAEIAQLCAAATVLFVGTLFDRSGADIVFIPDWWPFADGNSALFGSPGQYLPSFAHIYGFILLASALLPARFADPGKRTRLFFIRPL